MAIQNWSSDDLAPVFEADVDTDQALRLLANSRRRYVLALLHDRAVPMALADVAAEVAEWEFGTARDGIFHEMVELLHTSLHHNHAPRMADAGIVVYDPGTETIELTSVGHELGAIPALPTVE